MSRAADRAREALNDVYDQITAAKVELRLSPPEGHTVHYRLGSAEHCCSRALQHLSRALRLVAEMDADTREAIRELQAMVERAHTEPAPAPPRVPAEPASDVRMTGAE